MEMILEPVLGTDLMCRRDSRLISDRMRAENCRTDEVMIVTAGGHCPPAAI